MSLDPTLATSLWADALRNRQALSERSELVALFFFASV